MTARPAPPSAMVEAIGIAVVLGGRREDVARRVLAAVFDNLPREAMIVAAVKSFPAGLMGVGTAQQCVGAAISAARDQVLGSAKGDA